VAEDTTRIVIKGIRPYDGEYELDTERAFNAREWNWIKRVAGYMPNTIRDGLAGGDPDLYVALAVIAMCRAGKVERTEGLHAADVLSEAPFDGSIQMIFPEEEAESPLALTDEPERPSPSGSPESQSFSGLSSARLSGPSGKTLSSTGISESGTSARLSALKASAS
jgi:hypothetical protein